MKRLVTLLVIPMMLLGHVLPHTHAGTRVDRPDDHSARPHIHLAMHGHGHTHGETAAHGLDEHGLDKNDVDQQVADRPSDGHLDLFTVNQHDEDAVYLGGSTTSHHRLNGSGVQSDSTSAHFVVPEAFGCLATLGRQYTWSPQLYYSLPIYLLTASLRL